MDKDIDNYIYNLHSSGSVNESGMVYFNKVNTKYHHKNSTRCDNPAQSTLKLKQDTPTPVSS